MLVLIAEDDTIGAKILTRMLTKHGYESGVVTNGKLAVDAYRTGLYDLILMDINMPEMDGWRATRCIRALETINGKNIPIIAVTALNSSEDQRMCLDMGMDDYLGKPVDITELLKVLNKYSK